MSGQRMRLKDRRHPRPAPHLRIRRQGALELVEWRPARRRIGATSMRTPATREQLYQLPCALDDDVTLGDVMLLLARAPRYWHRLIGRWTVEYLAEATRPRLVPPEEAPLLPPGPPDMEPFGSLMQRCVLLPDDPPLPSHEAMTHLELRWHSASATREQLAAGRVEPPGEMELDGVGPRCRFSFNFLPAHDLTRYPLRVVGGFEVYDAAEPTWEEAFLGRLDREPALYHIVHGVLHELSFSGPPTKRDHVADVLASAADEPAGEPS